MRGWSEGRGGGLPHGGVSQSYGSDLKMYLDEVKGVYVGEMVSRSGAYRFEGPDRLSISMQMEDVLYYEYQQMLLELAHKREMELGVGLPEGYANVARTSNGKTIVYVDPKGKLNKGGGFGIKELIDAGQLALDIVSILQGNWLALIPSALVMLIEEQMEKGGEKPPEDIVYAVRFGGVLITAASRRLLMKKLQLQKNRRIQIIMSHMRSHQKNRDNASSTDKIGRDISGRLIDKKLKAERKWSEHIMPADLKERTRNLKRSIGLKRERAKAGWLERVV